MAHFISKLLKCEISGSKVDFEFQVNYTCNNSTCVFVGSVPFKDGKVSIRGVKASFFEHLGNAGVQSLISRINDRLDKIQ